MDMGKSSVVFPSQAKSKPNEITAWSNLNQKIWEKPKGIEWDTGSPSDKVASKVGKEIESWFSNEDDAARTNHVARVGDLTRTLQSFADYCSEYLQGNTIKGYKLKVAAMHGVCATRCPAWHTDFVPVRCIKTMLGPGSVYIDPALYSRKERVQYIVENTPPSNLVGEESWKDMVLVEEGLDPTNAPTGGALFLTGYRWSQYSKFQYQGRNPVLHRSPLNVSKDQGRVFSALDVVMEDLERDSHKCTGSCNGDH